MSALSLSIAESRPLRPYKAATIELLRAGVKSGNLRQVAKLPTGAGKTRIAGELIKRALGRCERSIFVVPRLSLIEQTVAAFEGEGIGHIGVIQGQNFRTDTSAPVQIASAQTLARRDIPHSGLVIIDECHLRFKAINDWLLDPAWAKAKFIGLSATPWAKGMGLVWQSLIAPVTITELIQDDFLCQFRVLAPPGPDLSGVRTTAGDYNERDLSDACDKVKLVGNVIETWQRRAEDSPTLCYGVDRKHAQHLDERFREAGIACEYIDCDTPMFEREEIFERFRKAETTVICNVATLDTGIDLDVRCIIDARPTKSRIRFVQTIGRGLRPAPGKDHLLILDHAGNHRRLGLVTDIDWEFLHNGEPGLGSYDTAKSASEPSIKLCPECHCVQAPRARECPQCGHVFLAITPIVEGEGDLVELGQRASGRRYEPDKDYWQGALQLIALRRGYKQTWAAVQFKEKFGEWPVRRVVPEREPTVEILNWVRSRLVAYAKARAANG
jgi:superfamily II DNA or RNA helicase